ncbi:hypothetical protein BV898_06316 [Hypsibius exemplaris]|uniref:Uncharacterized protein n=1 Tax=Hypsibius exemplaris TaxID=2072580 RepID=A0A1W0WX55_HYPEX|nr:hypothetical protein BV898_06316 [Hypsibius exemplaris]
MRCPGPDWYYRKDTKKCYFILGSQNPEWVKGKLRDNNQDGYWVGLTYQNGRWYGYIFINYQSMPGM